MKSDKKIGGTEHSKIYAIDKEAFGTNHRYAIRINEGEISQHIKFQKGPIKEEGHNGIQNEDLLIIVITRLSDFQRTEFACEENEEAAKHCVLALDALNKRTAKRIKRGVEGTNEA